jgi:two-component system chemotaxis sensor kinase CheA
MDPDLAAIVFVIPEDNFSLITLEQYQKPVQVVGKDQKVHTIGEEPEEKEPAPQEPVVPEIILAPEPVKRQKKGKLAELDMQEQETLRVKIKQLNKLVNLAGELVLSRNQLMRIAETHLKQATGFQSILKNLSIVISDLQEQIMNTRMQPISAICNKFPRIVRDLSGQLQKSVEFQIDGGEIELDKTIIEALADPLTHIIRNVVDHGIELPEERRALDKPATGSLLLKAYHESGQVIIEIQDDGKGIDPDKIASKALSKNIVSEFQIAGMTDREKIRLVFAPGFSTAESISNISGRGVGMDVVKTNIEKIGGTVELDSVVNHGTTVRMTLPLTLAIVSSLIAKVKDRKFIIPQVNIDELITLDSASLDERLGKVQESNVLKLRGSLLPLVPMSVALGFEEDTGDLRLTDQNAELRIIVVKIGAQLLGLIVDEILGIEEIVVKPLPQYLRILNQYSGCSILGDGSVALILDLLELAKNQRMLLEKAASHEIAESHGEPHQNQENRALLIFDNGTSEQFALPISSIERIDKITEQEIQTVGNKEFIEHQGRSMRVLRLEEILNLKAPDSRFGKNTCILILKNTTHLCSILIHNIVDSRSVSDELEQDTLDIPGVLGSIMVDKKITVLLDLPALLQLVFNETEAIC